MGALTGSAVQDTYKDLLHLSNSNAGLPDGSQKVLFDGGGIKSALYLADFDLDESSGAEQAVGISYEVNKAAGNDTGLWIAQMDTASGGTSYLQEWGTSTDLTYANFTQLAYMDNAGNFQCDGGVTAAGALSVGGGYGSTGFSVSAAGVVQANGALTTDGALTADSAVIGGGYGSTGATISTAGVGQFNGALTSDGAVTGASLTIGGGYGSTGLSIDAAGELKTDDNIWAGGSLYVESGGTRVSIITNAGTIIAKNYYYGWSIADNNAGGGLGYKVSHYEDGSSNQYAEFDNTAGSISDGTGTGQILIGVGTAAAPAIAFGAKTDLDGIFWNNTLDVLGHKARTIDVTIPVGAAQVGNTAPSITNIGTYRALGFDDSVGEEAFFDWEVPGDWVAQNFTVKVYWTTEAGDAIANTEDVHFAVEYRTVDWDNAGETYDQGNATTATGNYTSGGDDDKECFEMAITIDYDDGDNTIAIGDVIGFRFYRDTASEGNSYSGEARVIRWEISYSSTALSDHA